MNASSRSFLVSSIVNIALLVGCSGGTADLGGESTRLASSVDGKSPSDGGAPDDGETPGDETSSSGESTPDGETCTLNAHAGMVVAGDTLTPRPSGSVLRLNVAYQGKRLAITTADGVTRTINPSDPSDPPLAPGIYAGYWFQLQDASGAALYTQQFRDPTALEASGPPGGGGFKNIAVPLCDEKVFRIDVPNDAAGRAIVFFGSPYGTNDAASELGRFLLP